MPGIFVDGGDGRFVSMHSSDYASEAELQELLVLNPQLLLGDEPDEADGSPYLLIRREAGVPEASDSADRWSLDHLFVHRSGVPTLVEVKRASDTRARREVVAQMLDYAANISAYWSPERMRTEFESRCEEEGSDPQVQFADFSDEDYESFWTNVKTNLAAKRLRLIFLNDHVHDSLRTLVEYLNEQMSTTEVIAVEVRKHQGEKFATLVTQVIGNTSVARQAKSGAGAPHAQWNRENFGSKLVEAGFPGGALLEVLDWALGHASKVAWGTGQNPAVSVWFSIDGEITPTLFFAQTGAGPHAIVQFGKIVVDHKIPTGKVDQLVTTLRTIDGAGPLLVGLEAAEYRKSPKFSADPFFTDPTRRQEWTQAIALFAGIEPPS